ncbi:DNA-3-methyladenine glycosylase family protein [Motiliproteus sediminis]|uniref:DNA-3-methyladenine glycosylase family protein n=1 Tax=Motiliproteus sediminis TaxID=1468178 RepID=UPI001AEFC6C6|nr:DNA-3-methyladenine glycosylase 2 family protein [Motiliproteus sediminis]
MNQQQIQTRLDQLAIQDPDVQSALSQVGYPPPRIRPAGFDTLVSTIVSQQIGANVARVIMDRVREALPQLTPDAIRALPPERLRALGLSQRKCEYVIGLANAIIEGHFPMDELAAMDDQDAIDAIVRLRGFGRWSAEIYLMFSLGRSDIFPADDLALQVALQRLKRLEQRPTPKQCRELTAAWAPHRSAGALFLWHYYHGAPA